MRNLVDVHDSVDLMEKVLFNPLLSILLVKLDHFLDLNFFAYATSLKEVNGPPTTSSSCTECVKYILLYSCEVTLNSASPPHKKSNFLTSPVCNTTPQKVKHFCGPSRLQL